MASSKRVCQARAGASAAGFFVSISGIGRRPAHRGLALVERPSWNADQRAAVRTTLLAVHARTCRPAARAFACAAAVPGGDKFAPKRSRFVSRSAALLFSWRSDDALSDIARAGGPDRNCCVGEFRLSDGLWHEPDKLIGYCVTIYFAKLLVWDKVLGLGSTHPLTGFAAITANLVVSFYFAKRGFENVARIIKK